MDKLEIIVWWLIYDLGRFSLLYFRPQGRSTWPFKP